MYQTVKSYSIPLILCTLATTGAVTAPAIAQSTLADCDPPSGGEYLLLVLNESDQTPEQLRDTLPSNATVTVCNYLGREVSRVSRFTDPAIASSWAQYLTDIGGLQAFVARPPGEVPPATLATFPAPTTPPTTAPSTLPTTPTPTTTAPTPITPMQTAATSSVGYNPQPLGAGYAVLVDYANRPEVAADVQQLLSAQVGLVSYRQRPYLLAVYTTDPAIASSVLTTLSNQSYSAAIVDSRGAMLLTPSVGIVQP